MGFFGRLLGIENDADRRMPVPPAAARPLDDDAQALQRYRYMVQTAPPETLEQAYAEAFAKLTPEQRARVQAELSASAPEAERAAIAASPPSDAQALARVATRAEIRQPGVMERTLGAGALGAGSSLLSSFAMGFVGSMVAQSFFSAVGGFGSDGGAVAEAEAPPDDTASEGDYADEDAGFGDDFDV